jgi:hypothetical protein
VPAGYTIDTVKLRASYNAQNATPSFQILTTGGSTFCGPTAAAAGAGNQAREFDVSACMGSHIGTAYDVRWNAGAVSGTCSPSPCPAPQLDGIELIATLAPTNPNTTLRPQRGCITGSPNLWYGASTPDCSLLRVDASVVEGLSLRRGRLSIKGTVYAPSAAIDISDTDVVYPIASRGLIARHLRIRGFNYRNSYNEPAFSNWLDTTPSARQVTFYACGKASGACNQSDPTYRGRAAVSFEAVTSDPTVANWSVSEN